MMPWDQPDFDSAQRRGSVRRRAIALLAGLFIAFIAINLVLLLEFRPWMALQHKASLDHSSAGPSAVWPSIESTGPLLRQRLAAASRMLAAHDFRGAQHEYLMILLSVAPDDGQAWRGLTTLHRRLAAENPAELGRQIKAYRLAIRNGAEMDERYSPRALEVLAKATRLAAREVEGIRPRPITAYVTAYVIRVGEFVRPTMADRMMHVVRSKGYIVDVARRGPVSHVLTRPYRTRRQAGYAVHGLAALGLPATLITERVPSP
jgi:hypothetical protein